MLVILKQESLVSGNSVSCNFWYFVSQPSGFLIGDIKQFVLDYF